MTAGVTGKILFVDLTSSSIKEESLPEKVYREFIGGTGLGVRVLYERMKPKVDPLGPDNMLGFLTGLLTGTKAAMTGRFQVVGKSPLTGGWGDASGGGRFGPELKATGYDAIFFTGVSPKPVYLFLHDGKAELKDASHLWGKETYETEEMVRKELGDRLVRVASIGPAGEAKSLLACVMHEDAAAGRSGLGAVMGAKRLKAIAVRGTKKVSIADSSRFNALRKDALKFAKVTEHVFSILLRNWGTNSWMSPIMEGGEVPIKNWQLIGPEAFPNHGKLNADGVTMYQSRKLACADCPVGCHGAAKLEKGPYAISGGYKPEYETLAMLGPNCLNDDIESVIKANDLCNRYGLDTIGVGSVIGFAMECYERGLITKKDTDGIELTWGNAAATIAMLEKIARREGFGAVLADGSKRAAERIGKGSEKYAIHIGGQDLPAHDPRTSGGYSYGWGYVCDPTPARHTVSFEMLSVACGVPYAPYSEVKFTKPDMFDYEANAPIYATLSDLHYLLVSTGLCDFVIWGVDTFPLVEFISSATGWDFTLAEGLKAGRRIQTLRQAFNIREGINTSEWRLPERIEAVPSTGPTAGRKFDWRTTKEKGYAALGWDAKTGKPLDSTLRELGLKELVGQLA